MWDKIIEGQQKAHIWNRVRLFLRGKNIIRNLYYSKISKRKLKKENTISSGTGKYNILDTELSSPFRRADQVLYCFKQILTGLLVTKIYKNRTIKIFLFNYSMLGFISPITTSLPHIYRRYSCPTHIFKPTHQTGPQASSHPGIFQTNLKLFGTFCRFLKPDLIFYTTFCKKLDFPTVNHNRYIKLHWAQFPMIGNTQNQNFSKILHKNFLLQQ